jgi:hypothetical protein
MSSLIKKINYTSFKKVLRAVFPIKIMRFSYNRIEKNKITFFSGRPNASIVYFLTLIYSNKKMVYEKYKIIGANKHEDKRNFSAYSNERMYD